MVKREGGMNGKKKKRSVERQKTREIPTKGASQDNTLSTDINAKYEKLVLYYVQVYIRSERYLIIKQCSSIDA